MNFLNFLRAIRGLAALCLIIAGCAIILQIVANFTQFEFLMPSSAAIFMLGVMHIAFWLWVFIGLRRIINKMHDQAYGGPHPRLVKPWHL